METFSCGRLHVPIVTLTSCTGPPKTRVQAVRKAPHSSGAFRAGIGAGETGTAGDPVIDQFRVVFDKASDRFLMGSLMGKEHGLPQGIPVQVDARNTIRHPAPGRDSGPNG